MTIAHIENLELGLSVRTKLNALVDQSNTVGNGGITALTGDVAAGPGSGSMSATLASILTAGGPIGSSMTVPVISWDAKGRLIAVSSTAIAFPSSGITQLTGDVTAGPGGGSQAATLASILTAGGPVGSSTTTPVISWDAKGRLTSVGSATISGGGGGGASIGGAVTGGTSGSVLFIDASTNLAQDNANFFWDASTLQLKIGSAATPTGEYWLNGARALYGVPNAGGTNWFEAGAGNTTLTGYLNFGTGDGCLAHITSGYSNVGLGALAATTLTTGYQNLALGSQAMWFTQLDSYNIAIGQGAMATLGLGGAGGGGNTGNIGIGYGALGLALQGVGNVCLGYSTLSAVSGTANYNTIIGSAAGTNLGSGGATVIGNTLIGVNCGALINAASNSNTWIGSYRGASGAVTDSIALADGRSPTAQLLDYGLTSFALVAGYSAWSMSYDFHWSQGAVFHMYNIQNALGPAMTAYERAAFDWFGTTNVFRLRTQAAGGGTVRLIAIDGFAKAGAPAAGDLPSGSFAVIDDTSANQTWLCFNKAGTIRKVQLT